MKFNFNLLQILLSLTFCQSVYAQKNYEPGYIVKANRDTLNGTIEYLNWSKNPEKINFKSGVNGAEKIYGLAELSSFQYMMKIT